MAVEIKDQYVIIDNPWTRETWYVLLTDLAILKAQRSMAHIPITRLDYTMRYNSSITHALKDPEALVAFCREEIEWDDVAPYMRPYPPRSIHYIWNQNTLD